jgi:hypothetical protein
MWQKIVGVFFILFSYNSLAQSEEEIGDAGEQPITNRTEAR